MNNEYIYIYIYSISRRVMSIETYDERIKQELTGKFVFKNEIILLFYEIIRLLFSDRVRHKKNRLASDFRFGNREKRLVSNTPWKTIGTSNGRFLGDIIIGVVARKGLDDSRFSVPGVFSLSMYFFSPPSPVRFNR